MNTFVKANMNEMFQGTLEPLKICRQRKIFRGKKVTNVVNVETAANLLIPGLPASINFLGFHVKANNH